MPRNPQENQEYDWTQGGLAYWIRTLIAVAVVLLFMLVFFRVRTFEVNGNVRYTAQEVAEASGLTEGDILMGVNKVRTAGRLLVQLPYLQQVTIEKALPGTVRFNVVECSAAAYVESEYNTVWLISEKGKLLEEVEKGDVTSDYPYITGAKLYMPSAGDMASYVETEKADIAVRVLDCLRAIGISNSVSQINVEDPENVYLLYDGRIEVQLGDGSDAGYKLQYLMAVIPEIGRNNGVLDLSFSQGEEAVFHPIT